jgi:hypothetical protein
MASNPAPAHQASHRPLLALQILRSHLVQSTDDDQVVAQRIAPASEVAPPFAVATLSASTQDCVASTDGTLTVIAGAPSQEENLRPVCACILW